MGSDLAFPDLAFPHLAFPDLAFIALTLSVAAALLVGAWRGKLGTAVPLALLGGWLGLLALAAASGWLAVPATPPRFVAVLLPPLLAVILLGGALWRGAAFAALLHPAAVVGLQTFRLPLELWLHGLYEAGRLPALMTWEGRNFDIVAAATAPVVAWLLARGGRSARGVAVAWNILGLLLVLNVAGHGILAAPSPFQVIVTEPPMTLVTTFPQVWLPGFLVPVALALHLLSLAQLLRQRAITGEDQRPLPG